MAEPLNRHDPSGELAALRARLAEAEDTLSAIRHGEVDALLIVDEGGERVYTLRGADAPYRALVEQMHEGAVTLTVEGAVIYANRSFARLVDVPLEQVIGSSINRFVAAEDHGRASMRSSGPVRAPCARACLRRARRRSTSTSR